MSEKDSDRDTNQDAVMEPDTCPKQVGQNGAKKQNPRYSLSVLHYRKRLIDLDNLSIKAALDAIVRSGVLPDDSPKFIKEIRHEQIKSKEEKTVIIIERCGDEEV